jgi:hypothetical protein
MLYYDVANLVLVTKRTMIRQNAVWFCINHCCENRASSVLQIWKAVSAAPEVYNPRCLPQIWANILGAPNFDYPRWSILRMLLQCLRALCLAPGESGSILKDWGALVRSPGVSQVIGCAFQTELRFAEVLIIIVFNVSDSPCAPISLWAL